MEIRLGTVDELKVMWTKETPTKDLFRTGIEDGSREFWVVECEGEEEPIGELHIAWDSVDKDEANGEDRAYLCAFRIEKPFQGKKLGSQLMKRVFKRIEERGFKEITIGIDSREYEKLKEMYTSWGFTELLKSKNEDHHYVDQYGNPTPTETYEVYLKRLT
ncbi:GNAT family N-acetyltransferase [Oceanirhabdus seepicola]|uniref:GNAT family N-acetyltransferase n=1 Tax=Oceanirhabdus seepicola TaxID=2828781 RepID=A0A9J6P3L9_9CLOT|nr:GNAT family N-acetyltransferase [Oceanirhabdus seepicola]MCM1990972.1 GNAT family N-acetyltransferase [Oceanirhabdus seepicola]